MSASTSPSVASSGGTPSPFVRQQQASPTSFFFSSPRLDREASTSSLESSTGSSSDETEIATPPAAAAGNTTTSTTKQQQTLPLLQFDRTHGSNARAHYRTTDMLQFEGRANPNQVWICNRKPSSPLPGYVTPSTPALDQQQAQDCYFATSVTNDNGHQASPNCLHLGHRPKFVHSETVPDVQALQHEAHHHHHHHAHHQKTPLRQEKTSDLQIPADHFQRVPKKDSSSSSMQVVDYAEADISTSTGTTTTNSTDMKDDNQ